MDNQINKVYVETFGCSFNQADSQIMKGLLKEASFEVVDNIDDADLIILNTCYVKTPTQNRIVNKIQSLQKLFPDKKLVIAGCMVEIDQKMLEKIASTCSWIGPHMIKDIAKLVKDTLDGKIIRLFGAKKDIKIELPKSRDNPIIDIAQISEGCAGACSYCCTRFARKKLFSYPIESIVHEVESAVKGGCKEIWLTAQDTGAYGLDIGTSLPKLLDAVCKIEGKFFVRVGMMNPLFIKAIVNELIEIYKNDKIFKFLHLPVQSGSDKVLQLMKRGYKAKDFIEIVEKLRNNIPHLTLSTDIIVGFPGEEDDDFQKTIELIEKARPDVVNISKFGPRPMTVASKMEQINAETINKRAKVLHDFVKEIRLENNRKWLNWFGEILIDEVGAIKNTYVGRNFAYKPIVLKEKVDVGSFVGAKIVDVCGNYLVGKLM